MIMKIGLSSPLQHGSPEEWAGNMKRLGCESVVFPIDSTADAETIARYAAAAGKEGLQIADRLHARCCVNVIGSMGERWDGGYAENFTKKVWDRAVRMIQEVIDTAKPEHTYFTIEPMPWMYPTGPEEYLKLLEDVNRERFAVHMDVINMINTPERYFFPEKFVEHCFALLGDRIRSCHIKDIRLGQEFTFQLKECACGEGVFCLERYAELANEVDPDMPMMIEHLHTDQEYLQSLSYVKSRLASYL